MRHLRHAPRDAWRRCRGGDRAQAGGRGDGQGAPSVRVGAPRGFQGADEDSHIEGDSGGRHRKAPTHWTRAEAGARMTHTLDAPMTKGAPAPLDPPERLLMGPGPSNPEPSVLKALGANPVGHLDPYFVDLMDE